MWIINFFTEIFTHLLFVLGILVTLIGVALSFFPPAAKYKSLVLTLGLIVFIVGVYQEGKLANDKEWQSKVDSLQAKLDNAQIKSKDINTKVVTKIVTEEKIIKEKGDTVIEYVDREVSKHDKECPVPESAIIAHNTAARNKGMDEILTPNTQLKTDEHNKAANPNSILLPKK